MKHVFIFALITFTATSAFAAKPYEWGSTRNASRAVVGAIENKQKRYICRTVYKNVAHAGKTVAGKCNIGYGGKEIASRNYQLLYMNRPKRWTKRITKHSVISGVERGRKLYVCRAKYKNNFHPGKVVAGKCNIGYAGKEIALRNYAVLEYIPGLPPNTTTPSTNTTRPTTTSTTAQHIKWDTNSRNAVGVKRGAKKRYVCRAYYRRAWHPGYNSSATYCNIGFAGKEIRLAKYQSLTSSKPVFWSSNATTANVLGGVERGQKRFVCQVFHANEIFIGKTVLGKCNIGYGGKEIAFKRFKYLQSSRNGTALVTPKNPTITTPVVKPIEWRNFSGSYPRGVVSAGFANKTKLYVCRAAYKGSWHPGKVWKNMCHFGYGGKEIFTKSFQLLLMPKRTYTYSSKITPKSVLGGVENRRKLYVCRGYYKNGTHIGKTIGNRCNIGWGGKEIGLTKFGILRKL